MVRQICTIKDEILREVSGPVYKIDAGVKSIVQDLKDTLGDLGPYGAGLSAIQIGIPSRIFVFNQYPAMDEKDGPTVVINPIIESIFQGPVQSSYEGCLSIPGVFYYVLRPSSVTMLMLGEDGKEIKRTFNSQSAAVALHEYDHLNGVWFIDRALARKGRRDFKRKHGVEVKTIMDDYVYDFD